MKYFWLLILLFISLNGSAQQFKAFLKSLDEHESLDNVQIREVESGRIVMSDATGYFEIYTKVDNHLEFSRVGITPLTIKVEAKHFLALQQIVLSYKKNTMDEVKITGWSKYQRDSMARYELYRQDLERPIEKMKFNPSNGLVLESPISSWMQYIAPKTKMRIKFQKNFNLWEQQKFIETIYTAEKVAQLTGLKNDTLAYFMNAYPLPYETARTISDKQLEAWVLGNFNDWSINPDKIIRLFKIKKDLSISNDKQ